jgi:hypothetical protein
MTGFPCCAGWIEWKKANVEALCEGTAHPECPNSEALGTSNPPRWRLIQALSMDGRETRFGGQQ